MITEEIKKRNILNLEYGSKEMKKLAKKLQECNGTSEEDKNKLAAHIVEASFFLNCFGAASIAFSKAFNDITNNSLKGSPLIYLKEQIDTMVEQERSKQASGVKSGDK